MLKEEYKEGNYCYFELAMQNGIGKIVEIYDKERSEYFSYKIQIVFSSLKAWIGDCFPMYKKEIITKLTSEEVEIMELIYD